MALGDWKQVPWTAMPTEPLSGWSKEAFALTTQNWRLQTLSKIDAVIANSSDNPEYLAMLIEFRATFEHIFPAS